ncbi:hypothetical protein ADICYQ_4197 [Cyclobacterium qasimii M12-11B]|uniref:Uncharacterized protein n=2 Tax=Cyclobacterium qasimii TaxID=1350429 RepID=S7V970_9BACT|nr:hypothetical protein ADICYQ_4197 [Cyclobacterium qasimii M12-11B]GEO21657.1 hypothetical protein CQA01_21910 [Cyclobacterium qasimii]
MGKRKALVIMFWLLGVVLVFHFSVFFEFIPYDKVWAGRLKSVEEMRKFETVSIFLNVFLLTILQIKRKLLIRKKENKVINALIWVFAAFFGLNTIGNLFSESLLELILGTLLTLVSTILCIIIVKKG